MEKKKTVCTVFYDGSCPLCKREIDLYSKLDKKNTINWADVSSSKTSIPQGFSRRKLLSRIHLVDDNGNFFIGASAFFFIWNHLPGWKFLGRLKDSKLFFNFAALLYEVFLIIRPIIQFPFRIYDRMFK